MQNPKIGTLKEKHTHTHTPRWLSVQGTLSEIVKNPLCQSREPPKCAEESKLEPAGLRVCVASAPITGVSQNSGTLQVLGGSPILREKPI